MDSLAYFILTMLSLALIHSMTYNSRRLETIGYALSLIFLQQLITGDEDAFLICPQFPLYVSPRDDHPDPDVTTPDPEAKGVYVDHVLLLPRASQPKRNLGLSQAFRQAHTQHNRNLWNSLEISSLEVPLLEEKKRPPTRHPRDLDAHVWSILAALDAAQSQVTTQAKILFSSPRFATQDLVVLVASSGEFYRLAVLSRGHRALSKVPSNDEILYLLRNPGPSAEPFDVATAIRAGLIVSGRSPAEQERQRLYAIQAAEREEREKQKNARDARALARRERQRDLPTVHGAERELSQIVIDAGDPDPHSYSEDWIEAYFKVFWKVEAGEPIRSLRFQRHPTFFEPKPLPNETVTTLANLRNPSNERDIVFTGVIRLGSPASDGFFLMIRRHLSTLAQIERTRRK